MKRHLRLECGVPPQFKCPHCEYVSNRKGNINAHIAIKHENKTFDCPRCLKPYSSRNNMLYHLRTECLPRHLPDDPKVNSPLDLLAAIAKPHSLDKHVNISSPVLYETFRS
ncbi:hypothetical protein J6590_014935 [Homalodisca vitripennis]|nr:hypothetical protein J6590_014935 [Homalodisca vitripennis]